MTQTVIIVPLLIVCGGAQLIGSFIIGSLRNNSLGRESASLLAQWSIATTLIAIGLLLTE